MAQIEGGHLLAIRTLVLAAESGNLTAAARRLGLTPSAVSKQVSRLEAALGARLLERTTRRVRPTAAGLELVQRARPLFEAFDDAAATVRDRQSEIAGCVRISASRSFAHACLLPALARLAEEHQRLTFDVVLTARRLDFVEDEIDLAVREGPLDDSSLTVRRLGSAEIVLCAAEAYLARRGRPRRLDDLERHDLLAVPASGPSSDVARLRGRDGRRIRLLPRFRVNDLIALRDLAAAGAGIVLLPDYVAAPALASGALVRVLPRTVVARLPLHLVYPGRRHLPRRVQVVIEALRDAIQRRGKS